MHKHYLFARSARAGALTWGSRWSAREARQLEAAWSLARGLITLGGCPATARTGLGANKHAQSASCLAQLCRGAAAFCAEALDWKVGLCDATPSYSSHATG